MCQFSIGSDNGLTPVWPQAVTWANAGLLSIGTLKTIVNEILFKLQNFSSMKMHLKIMLVKWRPCCPVGDELLWWPNSLLTTSLICKTGYAAPTSFFDSKFLAATKQLYKWYFPSVRLSVCPSVRHTFLTMFPSSDHHEIFRSYYQWPT